MSLTEKAAPVSEAIVKFLEDGGTIEDLQDILTAWSVAIHIHGGKNEHPDKRLDSVGDKA
jgi:hypothetical protein